jgi:prevent-host-death family protein
VTDKFPSELVTTTEIQNNFGKCLKAVENGDIIITKNGKKTARLTKYREYGSDFVIREGAPAYDVPPRKVSYEEFLEIIENSDYRYEYIDGEVGGIDNVIAFKENEHARSQIFKGLEVELETVF